MKNKKNKVKIGLRTQLIGGLVMAIFLTVAAANVAFAIISYSNARVSAEQDYENLSMNIADAVDRSVADIQAKLSAFGQIAAIADPATPNDERVTVARSLQAALGTDISLKITDLDGRELVLQGEAEVDLSNRNYIQASLRGESFVTTPFYSPVLSRIMLVISQPLSWNDEIVGVLFMLLPGDFLNDAIVNVKAGHGGHAYAFASDGTLIAHNDIIAIMERNEHRFIEMARTDPSYEGVAAAVQAMVGRGSGTIEFVNRDNNSMLGGFSTTRNGWVVLVNSTVEDVLRDANQAITNAIIASAVCVGVVIIVAFFLIGKVVKPITMAANRLDKMAHGDITTEVKRTRSKSEVGVLTNSLEEVVHMMRAYISDIANTLVAISNGQLGYESEQEYKGDFIDIHNALNNIASTLSVTIGSIKESAGLVASGSKQMADGAQSLAQGSTQQSATMQELSSAISEISQKTKGSADMAERASTLVNSIMHNAEKGSQQMDEMTKAVSEIQAASQSISKVIKVIDDIAFQTNILALNAAVEAARAGQHGKGFAVVAEEVRNLAAKSAEAAKDTGSLITDSMEKAQLGARIASDTASSFTEIVAGVGESSQLIADIAKGSGAQAASITQVNGGIEQVAHVISQNSATAEESAAASEEMSSQSDILQRLVAQFELKNSDKTKALTRSGIPARAPIVTPGNNLPATPGSIDFGKY